MTSIHTPDQKEIKEFSRKVLFFRVGLITSVVVTSTLFLNGIILDAIIVLTYLAGLITLVLSSIGTSRYQRKYLPKCLLVFNVLIMAMNIRNILTLLSLGQSSQSKLIPFIITPVSKIIPSSPSYSLMITAVIFLLLAGAALIQAKKSKRLARAAAHQALGQLPAMSMK
jgi:flagellar biosynthesis component FlhA